MASSHLQSSEGPPAASETRFRVGTESSYISRLGVVWAYPLRLTIVTELHMQEMGVVEFHEKFDGGSEARVRWHFKVLAEHGWLRKVRKRKRRDGVGRPETVYRSTERAVYDDECARELPPSVRAAFSARILQQMGERIGTALESGTLDQPKGEHFYSIAQAALDARGWSEAIHVLNTCLTSMAHEQIDARVRLAEAEGSPCLMMVSLAGFESPSLADAESLKQGDGETNSPPTFELDSGIPLETRLAKVFGDPLNIRIVQELSDVPRSPSELASRIGGPSVWQFDRKCKTLAKFGWVKRVDEKTGGARRGSTEVYYWATRPPRNADLWGPAIPEAAKKGPTWEKLSYFYDQVMDAIAAGTLDARPERHLSWSPLLLDEVGWSQVLNNLRTSCQSLRQIEQRARSRLRASSRPHVPTTIFFSGFEIPPLGSATRLSP